MLRQHRLFAPPEGSDAGPRHAGARDALLAGIHASGWYTYFDHINAASDEGGFATHLQQLAAA
ncbi:hypothetical protein B1L07_11225 [Stenotrophomonas acidaminiphila]|nr:hypothetical protein B1L07_11225 [Stenotrophomonas acidaminiphila]